MSSFLLYLYQVIYFFLDKKHTKQIEYVGFQNFENLEMKPVSYTFLIISLVVLKFGRVKVDFEPLTFHGTLASNINNSNRMSLINQSLGVLLH